MNLSYAEIHAAGQYLVDASLGSIDANRDIARTWLWLVPYSVVNAHWGSGIADAIGIIRRCFPEAYLELIQLLDRRGTRGKVERFIRTTIQTSLGYEFDDVYWMDEIEAMTMGLPFTSYACYFLEGMAHDSVNLVMRAFGLDTPEAGSFHFSAKNFEPYDYVQSMVINLLLPTLEKPGRVLNDLHNLVGWLFGCTGNTSLDFTDEEFSESGISLMDWYPDNLKFMREMHADADAVVDSSLRLVNKDFQRNRFLWADFVRNVRYMLDGSPEKIRWSNSVRYGAYRSTTRYCDDIPLCPYAEADGRAWDESRVSRRPLGARWGARRNCPVRDRSFGGQYGLRVAARERPCRGGISTTTGHRVVSGRLRQTTPRAAAGNADETHGDGDSGWVSDLRRETAPAA